MYHLTKTQLILSLLLSIAASTPLAFPQSSIAPNLTEVGLPCGQNHPDCPTLTCIPLSSNCTDWSVSPTGCPGTCQYIDYSKAQVYTICGGWSFIDDCDERIEYCTDDPRNMYSCGPSCDDMGICWPFMEYCGNLDGTDKKCPEGKECFRNWTWGSTAGYGALSASEVWEQRVS